MQFHHAQLDNGLTLVAEVNPAAASLALGFFVRTGSRDEDPAVAGVSHFLEHMMFKGTQRRTALDINRQFDDLGAAYNAFTSEENTYYPAAVLPEFQQPLLDLLADMLRPALRQDDFQTEKQVILEEIALCQDQPRYRLFEGLLAEHFGEHPLSHSVPGTAETVGDLAREQMVEYFRRRYGAGNVTLVGAGNLNWQRLVEQAGDACGRWADGAPGRDTRDTPGTRRLRILRDDRLARQHVGLLARAPSAQDDRRYAAGVLAAVLGDTTGSRLFHALVEPAIAQEASCAYEALDGTGMFLTFLTAEPDRTPEALEILRREVAGFLRDGPTPDEVVAAANKIASGCTLMGELPLGRLSSVAFDWAYRREYEPLADEVRRYLAVTPAEVLDLARQFDLAACTTLALGPRENL